LRRNEPKMLLIAFLNPIFFFYIRNDIGLSRGFFYKIKNLSDMLNSRFITPMLNPKVRFA
jgi:hypothetical protein